MSFPNEQGELCLRREPVEQIEFGGTRMSCLTLRPCNCITPICLRFTYVMHFQGFDALSTVTNRLFVFHYKYSHFLGRCSYTSWKPCWLLLSYRVFCCPTARRQGTAMNQSLWKHICVLQYVLSGPNWLWESLSFARGSQGGCGHQASQLPGLECPTLGRGGLPEEATCNNFIVLCSEYISNIPLENERKISLPPIEQHRISVCRNLSSQQGVSFSSLALPVRRPRKCPPDWAGWKVSAVYNMDATATKKQTATKGRMALIHSRQEVSSLTFP